MLVASRLMTLVAVWSAALLCGCRSPLTPSDELRHESFVRYQDLFAGNAETAKRGTYIIFSGGPQFSTTVDSRTGSINWFAGGKGFSSGLAVALEPDGYLLTAGHTLDTNNFVFGLFDGKMDVRPARIVLRQGAGTHADLALIKVEGKLDHCAVPGQKPSIGDPVFAVVCYRKDTQLAIDFASGRVLGLKGDPANGDCDVINTDVPLGHGDSGGPLLSNSGQLVGINSGISYTWRKNWSDSFFPDFGFIQSVTAHDRLSGAADKPLQPAPP
jgi:S1-C subfamily serine protease